LEKTQVVLTGVTPGGEFKVASPAGAAGSHYTQPGVGRYGHPSTITIISPSRVLTFSGTCLAVPIIVGLRDITNRLRPTIRSADTDC
jgi:hypothetical protein